VLDERIMLIVDEGSFKSNSVDDVDGLGWYEML